MSDGFSFWNWKIKSHENKARILPWMVTIGLLGMHLHEVLAVECCSLSYLGGSWERTGGSTRFCRIGVGDLHTGTATFVGAVTAKTVALRLKATERAD